MKRWWGLLATVVAWVLCFSRHGMAAFACWFLLAFFGSIATLVAFAQARIDAQARPEAMLLQGEKIPRKPSKPS